MSGSTLLPDTTIGSFTCTLLSTTQNTTNVLAKTPKNKLNQQGSGNAAAAPVAFATDAKDDFADFAWLDDEGTDSVGDEYAQALDDLVRLESVFGNTEVDTCSPTSSDEGGSSIDIDADVRDDKAGCCVEDALEGGDAEGLLLLFDDELQGDDLHFS